jgi:hypothetical protein
MNLEDDQQIMWKDEMDDVRSANGKSNEKANRSTQEHLQAY